MKTNRRKALEMEAVLVGVKVTYAYLRPEKHEGSHGDRWYASSIHKYYIYEEVPEGTIDFLNPWQSCGSKRFFDLTCENSIKLPKKIGFHSRRLPR